MPCHPDRVRRNYAPRLTVFIPVFQGSTPDGRQVFGQIEVPRHVFESPAFRVPSRLYGLADDGLRDALAPVPQGTD